MSVSNNKPDMVDTNRQIVFSYFHKGKTTSLDAQEFRHYSQTLVELKTLPSTDSSGSGTMYPIFPYYDKDNAAFMSHKYIPRSLSLWHHACEVLYQALLKFYRQPSGAQFPGYGVVKGFQEGSFDGSKYSAAWQVIETLNGRNSSLDYIKVHRDYDFLDFDPRRHDFSQFLKSLENFRSELNKLDARERRITDKEILEEAKGTLIRTFGVGNYRPTDNSPFNSLLYDLSLDLIKAKTTASFVG